MRVGRAAVVAVVAVWIVLGTGGVGAEGPAAWEAPVLKALQTPPDRPRRAMLVFPLVDAGRKDGAIGWGRGLIAEQAMWRSSFAPDRLLDTWDFEVGRLYVDQQLLGPGRRVTPKKIENTCAAFECPNYTTGTLAVDSAGYRAELTFHGVHGERRKTYVGPREEAYRLPCAIAEDVVAYMGVEPTEEQRRALSEPPLLSDRQFERVAARYHYYAENYPFSHGQADDKSWLVGQPRTQWADDFVLLTPPYYGSFIKWRMARLPGLKDDSVVRLLRAEGTWSDARVAQSSALMLGRNEQPPDMAPLQAKWRKAALELAPMLAEDPYNPWLLGMVARAVGNAGSAQLHRAACERYIMLYGDGALARYHRGAMLLQEAWDARGSGWSYSVTEAGAKRCSGLLDLAADDMDRAAQLEPRSWIAQDTRIALAMAMGGPRAREEAAFRAALDACPTDFQACSRLLIALEPKWGGSGPRLLKAAREMASTGDAQAAIPRLLPEYCWTLTELMTPADRYAAVRGMITQPDMLPDVVDALQRCIEANPEDYMSQSMMLAVAYWKQDRQQVAQSLEVFGKPGNYDDCPAHLNERYASRYLYAEARDWLDHPDVSPLMAAARAGRDDKVRSALADGADPDKARDDGLTPLLLAAHFDHYPAAQALLEAGADVNVSDGTGDTPLHWAIRESCVPLIPILLQHGADPNKRNNRGDTPLHLTCKIWLGRSLVDALLQHGADPDLLDGDGYAALHLAAGAGYLGHARSLVEAGADVNVRSRDLRQTPLHLAAAAGTMKLIAFLVESGADVNSRSASGETPLLTAVANARQEAVEWLLEHGAKPDLGGRGGNAPLAVAAARGQTEIVRALLAHGASPELGDDNGTTPLQRCAQYNTTDAAGPRAAVAIADALLKAGADLDRRDKRQKSAMHYAAETGSVAMIDWLLAHGVKVDVFAEARYTPLEYAAAFGRVKAAGALLEHGASPDLPDDSRLTPLHCCALFTTDEPSRKWDAVTIAGDLIKRGVAVDPRDKRGRTPLFCAASKGALAMVRLLLAHGAAVDAPNKDKWTPLQSAARQGHTEVVRALLYAGADVNARDRDGTPSLHKCAYADNGGAQMAALLLERGAEVNARDRWQTTALHAAASEGDVDMARVLLDHGADIEARQQSGRTPLWTAASFGKVRVVRFLASKGADLNAKDKWDLTPLHAAAEKGQAGAARALLAAGADPNALNNDKLTPADIAEKKDHPEVADLLRQAAAHPAAATQRPAAGG